MWSGLAKIFGFGGGKEASPYERDGGAPEDTKTPTALLESSGASPQSIDLATVRANYVTLFDETQVGEDTTVAQVREFLERMQGTDTQLLSILENLLRTLYPQAYKTIQAARTLIDKTNQRGETVTSNQMSNMANIHQSLLEAKKSEDLIYFVEDDYLHKRNSIKEMIFTYERISSQINSEIIICPADYPYLYAKTEATLNFLGHKSHWRKVGETLCTFLTSKQIIEKYWDKYVSMCQREHAPFEKPMHEIYEKELCISPIPSLAVHFTNINSIFGLSPNMDWKKIWDENGN